MKVIAGVICCPGSACLCPFLKGKTRLTICFHTLREANITLSNLCEFVCRFICPKRKECRTLALRWRETTDSEGVHSFVSDQSKNSPES